MIPGSTYGGVALGGIELFSPPVAADKKIKLYYQNILETALSITPSSENASYPRYRLYDRQIGLYFKGSSAPSIFVVDIDQGNGNQYPINTVIMGPGHNLTDIALRLLHSADGLTWYQSVAWTGVEGAMRHGFDLTFDRYWRFWIENPSAIPEFTELFLTKEVLLERGPSYDSDRGMEENISRQMSRSGLVQKTILGAEKRARRFRFTKVSDAQRIDMEIFRSASYGKNIWIEDLEGELFFIELPNGIGRFSYEQVGRWGLTMDALEVLP